MISAAMLAVANLLAIVIKLLPDKADVRSNPAERLAAGYLRLVIKSGTNLQRINIPCFWAGSATWADSFADRHARGNYPADQHTGKLSHHHSGRTVKDDMTIMVGRHAACRANGDAVPPHLVRMPLLNKRDGARHGIGSHQYIATSQAGC